MQEIQTIFIFQLRCKKEIQDDLYYGLEIISGIQTVNTELCGLKLYHGMYSPADIPCFVLNKFEHVRMVPVQRGPRPSRATPCEQVRITKNMTF